jgi:hypothetical protein
MADGLLSMADDALSMAMLMADEALSMVMSMADDALSMTMSMADDALLMVIGGGKSVDPDPVVPTVGAN